MASFATNWARSEGIASPPQTMLVSFMLPCTANFADLTAGSSWA